jgi:hypothetical protein
MHLFGISLQGDFSVREGLSWQTDADRMDGASEHPYMDSKTTTSPTPHRRKAPFLSEASLTDERKRNRIAHNGILSLSP